MPRVLELRALQKLAHERGGLYLSGTAPKAPNEPVRLQCQKGHVWQMALSAFIAGRWCPQCNRKRTTRKTLADLHEIARERGWRCLSTEYLGANAPHVWECKAGHRWEAKPANIVFNRSGCPFCAGQVLTLDDMSELARKKAGKCLSKKYINSKSKLMWQCKHGHRFLMIPNNVQSGSWCPTCAGKVPINLPDMHSLAAKRNGKCLSPAYLGAAVKLRWKCEGGHIFEMAPQDVKQEHWCRFCHFERVRERHRRNRIAKQRKAA